MTGKRGQAAINASKTTKKSLRTANPARWCAKRDSFCRAKAQGGEISGTQLWRELKLFNQLGVTRGQMGK
jgi:hypothetical protein